MGTKGAEMIARPPAANVRMQDLGEWLKDLKAGHGVDVHIGMALSGFDELAMWRFTVTYGKTDDKGDYCPLGEKSLVWPTASHKTVLGALLWLLISISDDVEADAALARMRSAG